MIRLSTEGSGTLVLTRSKDMIFINLTAGSGKKERTVTLWGDGSFNIVEDGKIRTGQL